MLTINPAGVSGQQAYLSNVLLQKIPSVKQKEKRKKKTACCENHTFKLLTCLCVFFFYNEKGEESNQINFDYKPQKTTYQFVKCA